MRVPIIVATVAAMAFAAPRQAPERSGSPPNIVFILADDLGYGELGSYGQRRIRTPRLDRMAAEGMRFTQFYAGSTVCAPSRGTLLTGRHTGHAHVRDNQELGGFRDEEERGQVPLPAEHPTVARWLRDRGYATAVVGKWGLGGPGSTGLPTRQGFDFFFGYLDQKQAHNYYPTHLWRNEERFPNYALDGADNHDPYFNTPAVFPSPDALEEFSLQTSSYGADKERNAGAFMNAITKSGTNALRGSLFEFLRNETLNARNFFANTVPPFARGQPSGASASFVLQ